MNGFRILNAARQRFVDEDWLVAVNDGFDLPKMLVSIDAFDHERIGTVDEFGGCIADRQSVFAQLIGEPFDAVLPNWRRAWIGQRSYNLDLFQIRIVLVVAEDFGELDGMRRIEPDHSNPHAHWFCRRISASRSCST